MISSVLFNVHLFTCYILSHHGFLVFLFGHLFHAEFLISWYMNMLVILLIRFVVHCRFVWCIAINYGYLVAVLMFWLLLNVLSNILFIFSVRRYYIFLIFKKSCNLWHMIVCVVCYKSMNTIFSLWYGTCMAWCLPVWLIYS